MQTEQFRLWLVQHKRYSPRVRSDALSRCRRVERALLLSLDQSVKSQGELENVIQRIREEILIEASDKSRKEGQASLFHAVKRYHEFLNVY